MASVIVLPLSNLFQRFENGADVGQGHGVLHLVGGRQHVPAVAACDPVGPQDIRFELLRGPAFPLLDVDAGDSSLPPRPPVKRIPVS